MARREGKKRKATGQPESRRAARNSNQARTSSGSRKGDSDREDDAHLSWRRFAAVSLAALALMGDVTGIISGPWSIKLILGAASLILGVIVLIVRKRLTGLTAPVATSAAFIMLGVIVLPIGVHGAMVAASQRQRTALAATCSAAQDYREAYVAGATELAATGLPGAATRQANERALADLEKLTNAADRSGNQDALQLAQSIRLQATAAAAMNGSTHAVMVSNKMVTAWKSFKKLIDLCKRAGLVVSFSGSGLSGPWGITPSVRAACRYLNEFFYLNSRPGELKRAQHDVAEWYSLANLVLYNSLNVNDTKFWSEGRSFAKYLDFTVSPYRGIAPMYDDCVDRGIQMEFSNGLPPP